MFVSEVLCKANIPQKSGWKEVIVCWEISTFPMEGGIQECDILFQEDPKHYVLMGKKMKVPGPFWARDSSVCKNVNGRELSIYI